jgi:hypothetical protein
VSISSGNGGSKGCMVTRPSKTICILRTTSGGVAEHNNKTSIRRLSLLLGLDDGVWKAHQGV